MKRGLKVKSGVRAPVLVMTADEIKRTFTPTIEGAFTVPADGQLDAPLCTTSPPCGHCWYCRQREARP